MPHTSQDSEPDGDKVAAFVDHRRRYVEPGLAGFEDELRRRLGTEPNGSMGSGEWRKALDEWIAVHPYVQRRALREAFRSCPRDARTAEEVAAETIGRLWQDLSRMGKPALGWDGRASGFWPTVIWRQTQKTLRENDPCWTRRETSSNSETMQALLAKTSGWEAADARLLRQEDEERWKLWCQAARRDIRRVVLKLKGRPGEIAERVVSRKLDFGSIAEEFNVTRGTVLDHWLIAISILGQQVDLHALAEEYDVELPPEFTDAKLIDRLYRECR